MNHLSVDQDVRGAATAPPADVPATEERARRWPGLLAAALGSSRVLGVATFATLFIAGVSLAGVLLIGS